MARLSTPGESAFRRALLPRARRLKAIIVTLSAGAIPSFLRPGSRPGPTDHILRVIHLARRAGLPRRLHPQRLYVIGSPEKWAIFLCPCGTGHQIDLNLAHPGRPRWSVTLGPDGPSLRPSVDVRAARRCHFWLVNGRVRWCQDADG